ncbi:ATP12 family chaperone protein [Lutimaribacter marinistellae]|uniref:ATP12 family chaperone protein n=1 Tax=Lutimaribacter marinistellae TaxID=1820329 RepID=A0ABV7THR8_9RHOB
MSEWKPKRFWNAATVQEGEEGFSVTLDGRPVRTPAKAELQLPTRAMAEAIAAEWDAQENVVDPLTMPFTRSANAAIDKVRTQHAEVADMLAGYGDSDLLCYRATYPDALVARQAAEWDPALDWAEAALGARLVPVAGVVHQPQDPGALERLKTLTHEMDAFRLAAFHDLVGLSGSLVLGFAAARDWRDAQEIWTLSRLDETWQEEQWGRDEDAHAQAERKKAEFMHAKRFYDAAR